MLKEELIYISGPITADTKREEQRNLDRFVDAGVELTDLGHTVILPGENLGRVGKEANWNYRTYMRHDLALLKVSETVYFLQGWKKSRGSRIEHRYARLLKKGIIYEPFKDKGSSSLD